jgi:hypothetical protein
MLEKMRAKLNRPEVRAAWQRLTGADRVNVNEFECSPLLNPHDTIIQLSNYIIIKR